MNYVQTYIERRKRTLCVLASAIQTSQGHWSYRMKAHYLDSLEVTDLTASEAAKVAGCFNE